MKISKRQNVDGNVQAWMKLVYRAGQGSRKQTDADLSSVDNKSDVSVSQDYVECG